MFFESKNYHWERIDENLESALVGYDSSLMQTLFDLKRRDRLFHKHIHSQCAFIAKGKFEVQIENEKILSAGDSFFIPSELVHGVVCLEEGILVESFSPMKKIF
jgi:quercetin dioxygenase-like cupin family protein